MSYLPPSFDPMKDLVWETYAGKFTELESMDLTDENAAEWLRQWSEIHDEVEDLGNRIYVSKGVDTNDPVAKDAFEKFNNVIFPKIQTAEQALKEKFLHSGIEVPGFEIPLRNMRAEAALYREENIPLQTEEMQATADYDEIVGSQTVQWEGAEVTLSALSVVSQDPDRDLREKAWRLGLARRLQDREAMNSMWTKLVDNRVQQAKNAGFDTYTGLRWAQMQRFDYSPRNCEEFHEAIEEVVIPAAKRVHARRASRLGLSSVRPWDLNAPMPGESGLTPYSTVEQLEATAATIFDAMDPVLSGYYRTVTEERLLDLENRKGKAPGGYCTMFSKSRRPFIFMNAVGTHSDVQTLLHEAGHAFHVCESAQLPYAQQLSVDTEFAEVASMGMEFIGHKYLDSSNGGYYSPEDACRARIEHIEKCILFWPYMAVVDAFQHWVYANPELGRIPSECDKTWSSLWDRFMQGEDWTGLQAEKETGWHRKLHIFHVPFYYVEYGLAQLGAVQVWRNALESESKALQDYRGALALGGTKTLPETFQACGIRFGWDSKLMKDAVDLMEAKIEENSRS